jgi:3-hydroxyisobutyrate dehydrogenase
MSEGAPLTVAFLGLGIMGRGMARNLAKTAHNLILWNRTAHAELKILADEIKANLELDLAKAVKNADVIFTCVTGPKDLREIFFDRGAAAAAKKGALIIDCGTIGPKAAKQIAKELNTHGLRFLDAPVTGGDVGAKNGTLTFMVGGDSKDFEVCLPYFNAMGKTVRLCGPVGSGQSLKLCNQILCAVNLIAVCESIKLAAELDLDPQLVIEVCGGGAGGSWSLSNLGPRIVKDDFNPGFMVKDMLKDLGFVHEIDGDLPGVNLAMEQFEKAGECIGEDAPKLGTQAMVAAYKV